MKPHSSTSNSKIYAKRILAFLLALTALYGAASITASALTERHDDRNRSQKITKYQMQDFYSLPENSLDILILGSSHAMCTYDPMRIEQAFGKSAFNLGTALQQPDTSFFLLREVLKTQKPKYLIYDVYFKVLQDEYGNDQATTVLKEMPPSANSFHLFWQNLDRDGKTSYYNNWLNPFARIQNVMQNSGQEDEPGRTPFYRGRGFYSTTNTVSPDQLTEKAHPFPKEYQGFHPRQVEYLRKLLTLAQENEIQVILVSAPLPPTILSRIDYFDDILSDIQAIADEFSVPFHDFAKQPAIPLADTDFADQGHLNEGGNQKFMDYFISFLAEFEYFSR